MPDWNGAQLRPIRDFIVKYVKALNAKDFCALAECFTADAVLHRAMRNYVGKDEIAAWYRGQLERTDLRFELVDASAGMLPDSTAKCILWFEIHYKPQRVAKKDIHIESIDLHKTRGRWAIQKCFGLGYDPQHHRECFGRFGKDLG